MGENRHIQLRTITAQKYEKMTCIIAGNCPDGVTIVADRKVRYENGNVVSREKIFKDFHPYVIASSGDTMIFDGFRKKALELVQKSLGIYDNDGEFKPVPFDPTNVSGISQSNFKSTDYPVIQHEKYLKGLRELIVEKKAEIRLNRDRYPFDVLVGSQTDDSASLAYFDDNGSTNEINDPFIIIGSESAQFYGSMFVKPLQKPDTKMSEFCGIGLFYYQIHRPISN